MRKLIFALAALGLVAVASITDTASAYYCNTTCYRVGGQQYCNTNCMP
jgi:hypothetical protein